MSRTPSLRPPTRRRRQALAILLSCATFALSCSSSSGRRAIRCSYKNPATITETFDSWTKFRRDRQNTGTIRLGPDAFDRVTAGDPSNPEARTAAWVFPPATAGTDSGFIASPVLSPAGNVLYIGSGRGRLIGLQTEGDAAGSLVPIENEDGVRRDELATAEPFSITAAALIATRDELDAVFAGTAGGFVFGVNAEGNRLDRVWPASLDAFVGTSPTLGLDGTIFAATLGSGLFALCPNGVPRFTVATGSTLSSPALGRDATSTDRDGTVYIGADDGILRAIRPTGIIDWQFALSGPILASPVVWLEGQERNATRAIFAVDSNGRLARLTPSGRAANGFTPPSGLGQVSASPAFSESNQLGARLYVASRDAGLHAIDADTGSLLWTLDLGVGIESSPAVALAADGDDAPVIVFGADDGVLYFVRDAGAEAEIVATYTTSPALPIVSSPAIGADGTVYFGSLNGRVYAID